MSNLQVQNQHLLNSLRHKKEKKRKKCGEDTLQFAEFVATTAVRKQIKTVFKQI